MIKTLTQLLAFFGFILLATGCDRPVCENANSIFDRFGPDAKEYKDELVKQLVSVNKSQLSYWMEAYQENNGTRSILANVQGGGLCAKILLNVNDSNKGIEELLKTKGVGYRGAELENLTFDIKQDSLSTEFIFREIIGIAD